MKTLTQVVLLLMIGGGLGWFSHDYWQSDPVKIAHKPIQVSPDLLANAPSVPIVSRLEPVPQKGILELLEKNEYDTAIERYESLQTRSDDVLILKAREAILFSIRRLIRDQQYLLARGVLERYLVAEFRDVEARILLSETYLKVKDYEAAIAFLYEAKGHAFRPTMLARLTNKIRMIVADRVAELGQNGDQFSLLAMYQQLTQLEPERASYFIGLAMAQIALNDIESAQRSLLLVLQDPNVGTRAQLMLAELQLATDSESSDGSVAVVQAAGIPLHRSGHHFLVDARPNNGREVRLLIDTGASMTILTPEVLGRLGVRYKDTGRTTLFNTANGQVQAPVYVLDSLVVGDWQVRQLEIGVLHLGGKDHLDGLLGMNYLQHFQFFIDQNNAKLRLSLNPEK